MAAAFYAHSASSALTGGIFGAVGSIFSGLGGSNLSSIFGGPGGSIINQMGPTGFSEGGA